MLQDVWNLDKDGTDTEFSMIATGNIIDCQSMSEEEYILTFITQGDDDIDITTAHIHSAFGFDDEAEQHYMLAAVVTEVNSTDKIEYSLVVATGTNYGKTQSLKVLNYNQAIQTIDAKEWLKAIHIDHRLCMGNEDEGKWCLLC